MKLQVMISVSAVLDIKQWRTQASKRPGFHRFLKTNDGEKALDANDRVLDSWYFPKQRPTLDGYTQELTGTLRPDGSQVIIEPPTHETYTFVHVTPEW
jgi:hypothetical protein